MTKGKVKKKQQENKASDTALYLAGVFWLLGLVFGISMLGDFDGGFFAFIAKCESYLLGRVVFVLPVTCLLLAWKLFWDRKIVLLQKKTVIFLMVMLCLLGTAHHVFVPFNEELVPSSLPKGGGLLGALVVLSPHRYLGSVGTGVALAVLWLGVLNMVLPLRTIWNWLADLLAAITGKSDAQSELPPVEPQQEAKPQKQAPKQAQKRTFPPVAPKRTGDTNSISKVYRSGEFGTFTKGIEEENALNRILGSKNNPYEQEPVKQEVEQDPIQVPEWQENGKAREPNVILRPVIDYDGTRKTRTLQVPAAETAEEQPEAFDDNSVTEASSESLIHNGYHSKLEQEGSAPPPTVETSEAPAPHEPLIELVDEPSVEECGIKIYDSADKVQGAEQSGEAATTTVEPKQEAAQPPTSDYLLPPLELLDTPKVSDPTTYQRDIMEQCAVLEQTLEDFRVKARVIAVTRGPSVTRFELEPAPGVKVSSVVNLADDIALRLAAPGVRIEAPIPGKSAIGIEAPNIKNDTVCFREVVDNEGVRKATSPLCIGLGKDISGDIISVDLAKMPHLLVAGSTGSGKSVCINTIIAGILYRARPEEVKLILVDPKVVELSNYNGIPHLLTPVVTEPKKAASALHWAVAEMERRYKLFADSHVREINSYNAQAAERMPFIVIIIDELSDLMMVAKVDVEDAILRLAQKARAAGIHLILATQRPSVDVITGIVKANIPSRIAFAVSSQTDSRTIIDMGGAEKLLGKGDMLFYPIGYNKPVRVQGAFVTDSELNKIVDFIVNQSIPVNYTEEVTEQALECDNKNKAPEEGATDAPTEDELFADALSLVLDMGQASSSMLQRRFRIGYTRAARLVDTMEELGIVGQSVGSKPREVIMSRQEVEERFLKA